ncbi:hypothetical protein V8E36_004041 [Tilletia maclaganii]
MASLSFYVPPPRPAAPLPINRPAFLRDVHRIKQLQATLIHQDNRSAQLQAALAQVESSTGLCSVMVAHDDDDEHGEDSDEDTVKIKTYKLTMQSGQHLRLILYTGSSSTTQTLSQAHTYASLLSALHSLTAPGKMASTLGKPELHHSPLRILRPRGLFAASDWAAVLVEDLGASLHLDSPPAPWHRNVQTEGVKMAGTGIRALTSIQAGSLADILSTTELDMLRSHLLQHFDDVALPLADDLIHLNTKSSEVDDLVSSTTVLPHFSRLQIIQPVADGLPNAGQRKDSAIAGLGYSPESAFAMLRRAPTADVAEMRERSRSARTFEPSPERGLDKPQHANVAELLVNVELLCHPKTHAIRLGQGGQKLFLHPSPAAVARLVSVQLLSERP